MNEPLWLREARKHIGLAELNGARHEKKILQFYAEAGHPEVKYDETAWCAAFANAMLKRTGYKGTGSLAARSFLNWGQKLDRPREGCIVVFKSGNSSWQGHVGFYVSETVSHITVLGGNQNNSVCLARYPKSSLLGYRWPRPLEAAKVKPLAQSRTIQGAAASGAGGVAIIADSASEMSYQVEQAQGNISAGTWIGLVIGGLILFGAGYAIYARWDDAGRPLPKFLRRKHA